VFRLREDPWSAFGPAPNERIDFTASLLAACGGGAIASIPLSPVPNESGFLLYTAEINGISAPVTLTSQQVTFGPTAMTANVQWVEVDGSLTYTDTEAIVVPYSTAAGRSSVSLSTGPVLNYLATPAGETINSNALADAISLTGSSVSSQLCIAVAGAGVPSAPDCISLVGADLFFPDAATAQSSSNDLINEMLAHHVLVVHS
jgi:hypothetical protein